MKKVLFVVALTSFYSTAFAVLGSRNPNHIYYGMNGYVVFRQCSNHLTDPSSTCELIDETGKDVPVPMALLDKDFKESLFRMRADETMAGANIIRYLGSNGSKNLSEDILLYEKTLHNETIDLEELTRTRDYLSKIRKLNSYFEIDISLFADLNKPEVEIVTAFDKRVKAANRAFAKAWDKVLIFDPLSRVWWAYLGKGDYYDANNERRMSGHGRYARESEYQHNLGGCKARIKASKLPSKEQLRNINRQPELARNIKERFNDATYDYVWTNTGDVGGIEPVYYSSAAAISRRSERHAILCVIETR